MQERKKFIKLIILYVLIGLLASFLIPRSSQNGWLLGFSLYRIALIGIFVSILTLLVILIISLGANNSVENILDNFLALYQRRKIVSALLFLAAHLFILLGFFFLLSWVVYHQYSAYFLRVAPLCFLIVASGFQTILWDRSKYSVHFIELSKYLAEFQSFIKGHKLVRSFLYIGILAFGCLYLYWGINYAILVNQNPSFSDQHGYLLEAKQAYDTDFQYRGNRNHMPIYPYLLALLYKPDMSDIVFFEMGKIFNVFLSLMLLVGLYFVLKKTTLRKQAIILSAVIGVGLLIYKSGYVQPEVLYYFLYFVSYVLMLKMIREPRLTLGVLTGFVLAITYLVKASVVPSLVVFLAVLSVKQAIELGDSLNYENSKKARSILLAFRPVLLVLITFILFLSPYLAENKKMFGKYFYNVNSTFYIWNDDWSDAKSGTYAHGDGVGWPDMPDDEIPTMQKYFKEHTLEQIIERFDLGAQSLMRNISRPYSYFNYPIIYSYFFIFCFSLNFERTLEIAKKNIYQISFVILILGSNLILYAWYAPIADYHTGRFTYGLYMPFMYSIFLSITNISEDSPWKNKYICRTLNLKVPTISEFMNIVVVGLLIYEVIYHIPVAMATGWYAK